MTNSDHFITRNAAAAMKGCSRKRIDTAIRDGRLAAYEVAGRVVVKESDAQGLELTVRPSTSPAGTLTRTAAAQLLGTYPQRVTAMIARGQLHAEEIDGMRYLDEAVVRELAKPKRICRSPSRTCQKVSQYPYSTRTRTSRI